MLDTHKIKTAAVMWVALAIFETLIIAVAEAGYAFMLGIIVAIIVMVKIGGY